MKKYIAVALALLAAIASFAVIRYEASINAVNPITSDLPIVPIIILGCVAVAAAVVFVIMGKMKK